ncbi:MAG: hypothetical protein IKE55_11455 [Kiritimatiellae bacterium]|nr:hypothetical protein [Kiritimatiellia bacterium]
MQKLLTICAAGCIALVATADTSIRHLEDTYLQSDGSQAVNLGYYANPKTRIEVVFTPVVTNGTLYVCGSAWSSGSDFQEGVFIQNGNVNFVCGDVFSGDGAFGLGSGVKATHSRFTGILDVKGLTAKLMSGDAVVWSKAIDASRVTKTDNLPMHVFANPHGSVSSLADKCSVKLYSFAVYDDDVLVRDLVPYGRGAVTGLLDRCSGKVYEKTVGNAFVLGTDDGYVRSDREKNGGQWLDAGCRAGPNTKIEVDFQMMRTNAQHRIFSGAHVDEGGLVTAFYINGGGEFAWAWQNGTGNWTSTKCKADTARHVFTIDSPNGTVELANADGTVEYSDVVSTVRSNTGSQNLRLFGSVETNGTGGVNYTNHSSVRIYGMKIWESGNLVRNFSPRIVGGEPGLYDLVHDVFYGCEMAKPSGALYAGGAIACDSASAGDAYLESYGSQMIDTGYCSKRSTRIEADFSMTQSSGTQYIFAGINTEGNTWSVAHNIGLYYQLNNGNKTLPFRYWDGSATKALGPLTSLARPTMRMDTVLDLKGAKGRWLIGGNWIEKNLSLPASTDNPAKLQIFARNGGKDCSRIRLYSFAIYEDDVLQHSYSPCEMDGVAGLWDCVEGVFLCNTRAADGSGFKLCGAGTGGSGMVFLEHPQSCSVNYGESTTLSAFAPGAVGYIWLKNGEIIEGATGRTLEVFHSKGGRTDAYQCLAHYNLFGYGLSDTASVENVPQGLTVIFR